MRYHGDTSFMRDGQLYEFIRQHGTAHSYNVTYGRHQFSGGYWKTSQEAQEQLAIDVALSSYERPKWWHFWAWSQKKPSAKLWQRVLDLRAYAN